jgi:TPR repeat protein
MPRPVALYNLSLDYLNGEGVPRDEKRAFELNARAAALGYGDAVLAMGWFYLNGVGVDRDPHAAERWYRKSAREGEPRAMFSLGQMAYERRDDDEALAWFTRAFAAGHVRSGYWLGKLHWRGRAVSRSRPRAMALFHQAAAGGAREARRTLQLLSRPISTCAPVDAQSESDGKSGPKAN